MEPMQVQKLIAPSSEMFCFVTMVTEVCCTESVHVDEGNDYLFFNFWQFVLYLTFMSVFWRGWGWDSDWFMRLHCGVTFLCLRIQHL